MNWIRELHEPFAWTDSMNGLLELHKLAVQAGATQGQSICVRKPILFVNRQLRRLVIINWKIEIDCFFTTKCILWFKNWLNLFSFENCNLCHQLWLVVTDSVEKSDLVAPEFLVQFMCWLSPEQCIDKWKLFRAANYPRSIVLRDSRTSDQIWPAHRSSSTIESLSSELEK